MTKSSPLSNSDIFLIELLHSSKSFHSVHPTSHISVLYSKIIIPCNMASSQTLSPLRQFVNDSVAPNDTRHRIGTGCLGVACTNKVRRRRRFRRPWRRGQLRLTGLLSRVKPLMRPTSKSSLRAFQLTRPGRHCAIPAELRRRMRYSRWTTSVSCKSVNASQKVAKSKRPRCTV